MPVRFEEVEIGVEVKALRSLGALEAKAKAIVEVVVDVRAGQVNQALVGGARTQFELAASVPTLLILGIEDVHAFAQGI